MITQPGKTGVNALNPEERQSKSRVQRKSRGGSNMGNTLEIEFNSQTRHSIDRQGHNQVYAEFRRTKCRGRSSIVSAVAAYVRIWAC